LSGIRGTFLLRPKWNFLDVLPKNCSRLDIPAYDMMLKGSERADEYKKKLLKETDQRES